MCDIPDDIFDNDAKEKYKMTDVTGIDLGKLIAYEQGELEQDEIIEFFQHLVDTGFAWELQGSYGRTAKSLIEAGYVELKQ